jgi:hypothetical protein
MAAGFRAPTLLRFTAQVEATLPHANPAPCFWIILPGKRMRRAESGERAGGNRKDDACAIAKVPDSLLKNCSPVMVPGLVRASRGTLHCYPR